jgi:HSP20 family protein
MSLINRNDFLFNNTFSGLQTEIDNLFGVSKVFNPALSIEESNKEIVIYAELPGVPKENVSIELKDNILTLEGEKKDILEGSKNKIYLSEVSHGKFKRSFRLPNDVDPNAVKAKYTDGVLTMIIGKKSPSTQNFKINIE